MNRRLPVAWWLVFPPLLLVVALTIKTWSLEIYDQVMEGEQGIIELGTAFFALGASVLALQGARLAHGLGRRDVFIWFLVVAVGCLYIGGEELSWGQQLFHWHTPHSIEQLNRQHETNLHNMSSWFNEKPRILVELSVLVGGVLLPAYRYLRRRPLGPDAGFAYWLWPPSELFLTGLLAILVIIPKRYEYLAGVPLVPLNPRWSELQEYYFALFLWLYALSVVRRLEGLRAGG